MSRTPSHEYSIREVLRALDVVISTQLEIEMRLPDRSNRDAEQIEMVVCLTAAKGIVERWAAEHGMLPAKSFSRNVQIAEGVKKVAHRPT